MLAMEVGFWCQENWSKKGLLKMCILGEEEGENGHSCCSLLAVMRL